MTIKEQTIIEDELNTLERDIKILVNRITKENDCSRTTLNEYLNLFARRQAIIDLIFSFGYWFKTLHDDGWEIDSESFK